MTNSPQRLTKTFKARKQENNQPRINKTGLHEQANTQHEYTKLMKTTTENQAK